LTDAVQTTTGKPSMHPTNLALWVRKNGLQLALELAVNFVLPLLIYDRAAPHWGDAGALLASSAPPILWSLAEFGLRRRVDALSMLVLAGIALSMLAFVGGGSARFLQLRENMVTAIIGLAFLGSAAIGRPLIYLLARAGLARKTPEEVAAFESKRNLPRFRRVMTFMTFVWGFGLLGSAVIACVLVYTLSIHDYLVVSPFVGNGAMGALALWTVWYRRRAQRRAAGLDARSAE
jgi:multisubunit Na+/H+ antiporter MnhC subunit